MPDDALCRSEVRRAAGTCYAIPHPGPARALANPGYQRAARPSCRTWCRCTDGAAYLNRLAAAISDEKTGLPEPVRQLGTLYLEQIEALCARVNDLDQQMRKVATEADSTRRLQTMPGVGPITAMAIETFAPPMTIFRRSRDFAAWLGLVPRQHSTGGKQRLGATSKMCQRDIRRLLITKAMPVVQHASRKGAPDSSWLGRMLARKPRMLVAIALANKMARGLWAMMTTNKDFKNPATAPA